MFSKIKAKIDKYAHLIGGKKRLTPKQAADPTFINPLASRQNYRRATRKVCFELISKDPRFKHNPRKTRRNMAKQMTRDQLQMHPWNAVKPQPAK